MKYLAERECDNFLINDCINILLTQSRQLHVYTKHIPMYYMEKLKCCASPLGYIISYFLITRLNTELNTHLMPSSRKNTTGIHMQKEMCQYELTY